MSANVEAMFSAGRVVPWHGLGKVIDEAPTSAKAIELAGLDWEVEKKPLYLEGGIAVPDYFANVRSTDGAQLGVVGSRYQIVQNKEAFAFTDSLIEEGELRYETAGSLNGGRTVWMLGKMPQQKILDDAFDPYICFTNSHDGTGAVKVIVTPIRVVCQNTLNLAVNGSKRSWSAKHTGSIMNRRDEAMETLGFTNKYMKTLSESMERLAYDKVDNDYVDKFLAELYPISNGDSDVKKQRAKNAKNAFYKAYIEPDIVKYMNTKYGLINAITDMVDHSAPIRNTANYRENNWGRIMNGHPVVDKAYTILTR